MLRLPEKGRFDYLRQKKRYTLCFTLLSFLIIFIIYMTGVIIYKNNKSIYTVIAAVAAIPTAKILLSYIMIVPYKYLNTDDQKNIVDCIEDTKVLSLYNMILTSEERALHYSVIFIYNGHVLAYVSDTKTDNSVYEKYLKRIITCKYRSLKVYGNLTEMLNHTKKYLSEQKLTDTEDERIKERLLAYSL